MQLRKSERRQAKIKLALQGGAGSGKTMSALLLAKGLVQDFSKVAIIDTENGSADLYAHIGSYNVLPLLAPHSPERYIKAIEICEGANMEVIIIDSISHCWDFLLDYHSGLSGNSFTNWNKITPLQKAFVEKMLQSNTHIIATMRVKQDYVLTNKNGKMIPEKVGLKAIQRDGVDYEFTIVFDLDITHHAKASKDRTGLFSSIPEFTISAETGTKIRDWCSSGTTLDEARNKILQAKSQEELIQLYNQYKNWYVHLEQNFKTKKIQLEQAILSNPLKTSQNGITTC